MTLYTTYYPEISIHGSKSGKCLCGKRRARSMKFYQTLSEFNLNGNKAPKSRQEVLEELKLERELWQKIPITCKDCEKKGS